MSILETIKRIAEDVKVMELREAMGCPECRSWKTSTRDGQKEYEYPDGWRPSCGQMHCANQRIITAAEVF